MVDRREAGALPQLPQVGWKEPADVVLPFGRQVLEPGEDDRDKRLGVLGSFEAEPRLHASDELGSVEALRPACVPGLLLPDLPQPERKVGCDVSRLAAPDSLAERGCNRVEDRLGVALAGQAPRPSEPAEADVSVLGGFGRLRGPPLPAPEPPADSERQGNGSDPGRHWTSHVGNGSDRPASRHRERIPSTAPLAAITSSPDVFLQTWDIYLPFKSNG